MKKKKENRTCIDKHIPLTTQQILLETGIFKVRSTLLELHPNNTSTISRIYIELLISIRILLKNKKLFIVGLVPKNNWKILKDKKIFSDIPSLITLWLQTSALELIGTEKVFKPFWNKQCSEISKKLWLPTKTDSTDSNSSWRKIKSNSWFSISKIKNPTNSQKTSCPSSMFTHVDEWEKDVIGTRKIKMLPTQQQKKLLNSMNNNTRYLYNKCLGLCKQGIETFDHGKLRNKYVTARHNKGKDKNDKVIWETNTNVQPWELETPKDVRDGAIRDLVGSFYNRIGALKKGLITHFKLKFRKRKNPSSFVVPKSSIELVSDEELFIDRKDERQSHIIIKYHARIFPTYFKDPIKLVRDRCLKNITITHDCRIKREGKSWYLLIPIKLKTDKHKPKDDVVALDPGGRTFQTAYSERECYKIGDHSIVLTNIRNKLDRYRSLRSRTTGKTKIHIKTRLEKTEKEIKDKIDELHYKTINYLCRRHTLILLPTFESQEMVKGTRRQRVNRELMGYAHYRFKERLKFRCKRSRYVNVEIVDESYTTKTCGLCGYLNYKVGSSKVYHCIKCEVYIDRDVNGSRNIYIRTYIKNKVRDSVQLCAD